MVKAIELILVAILLAFSFFAGVRYSEAVREHAGWLFESRDEEEEIEIPDLSGGNGAIDIKAPVSVEKEGAPDDSLEDEVISK